MDNSVPQPIELSPAPRIITTAAGVLCDNKEIVPGDPECSTIINGNLRTVWCKHRWYRWHLMWGTCDGGVVLGDRRPMDRFRAKALRIFCKESDDAGELSTKETKLYICQDPWRTSRESISCERPPKSPTFTQLFLSNVDTDTMSVSGTDNPIRPLWVLLS